MISYVIHPGNRDAASYEIRNITKELSFQKIQFFLFFVLTFL